MTHAEQRELLHIAENARAIATYAEVHYGKTSPNTVKHVVAALETRAEEIEDFCRRHPVTETAQTKSAGPGSSVEQRIPKQ